MSDDYDPKEEQEKRIKDIQNREEEAFLKKIASRFGIPYIDLTKTGVDTNALSVLSEEEARKKQVAGFKLVGNVLHIALRSPNLPETKELLQRLQKKYEIVPYLVSRRSLEKAWHYYADISESENVKGGFLDIDQNNLKKIIENVKTNKDIEKIFLETLESDSKRKTSELLEIIFGSAIATKSSDIHIEPQEEQVRIRYRQDGVLQDIVFFDHESYKKILSRIKLLSKMKLTEHENAQDGRFTIDFDGKEIEVRVSVIPSAYGESFVMRILDPDGINVGMENLGIEPKLYEILTREIQKPNGMILTTGPTGSGKTTTLYSILKKVYTPEVKILTIEDPIEYHLEGISQTQIDHEKGYDFLAGLRAALRQDPDIIMVGEIRDPETATIAVNASLTGHLVLSTLHTNSAAGVIPRLIDLGISPQILAAALSVSLAQRLVRKVCTHCAYEVEPTEEEEIILRNVLKEAKKNRKPIEDYGVSVDQKFTLKKGRGCDHCNGTGYKGRIGIFEAIITDETIEELLNKKPSEQEVRRVADKQGLLNMREDGAIKIIHGVTSFEEVSSVVDMDLRKITYTDDSEEDFIDVKENEVSKNFSLDREKEINFLEDYLEELEKEQRESFSQDREKKIKELKASIEKVKKRD